VGSFICKRSECASAFKSKHSTAKYCSRSCSNKVNVANIVGAKRPRRYSDQEILQLLSSLAMELGRTPSKRDVDTRLKLKSGAIAHHFGTFNRAIEMAGLAPNLPTPPGIADDERLVGWALRFHILSRDGFRCVYCGGAPGDGYILHIDHVTPKSRGGLTEEGNLVTACHVCNMGKGAQVIGW